MNLLGTFEDNTGRRLVIRSGTDPKYPYGVRVVLSPALDLSLRQHRDYPFEIQNELPAWLEVSEQGECLVVEGGQLGLWGIGPYLRLFPERDCLKPEVGMGLYDDFEDDYGLPWAFPLSHYRKIA